MQPIIVDEDADVAVLLIPSQNVKKFESDNKRPFPGIPAKQLSNIKPQAGETITLKGFPGFIPISEQRFYRKEFTSKGPDVWSMGTQKKMIRAKAYLHGGQRRGLKEHQGDHCYT